MFRAKKFEPQAYTLYSYAAVQIIKQAAEAAKSLDPKKVAEVMHSGKKFKTVLGDISYDKKGDVTRLDYVMYVWKKDASGKITYVECPSSDVLASMVQADLGHPLRQAPLRNWPGAVFAFRCSPDRSAAPETSPAARCSPG